MKERFLNLNSAGWKILAAVGVLLAGIPGCGWVLTRAGVQVPAIGWIVRVSLWTGAGLLAAFILLNLLEQILDARLFRAYRKTLNRRIPLADGSAECPSCGFRGVRAFETTCSACGKELA